jgi:adenine phosphoribosyltransferase
MEKDLRIQIRHVMDFPRKGIVFRDITTLLKNPQAFSAVARTLYEEHKDRGIDKVAAIEARGFIFGATLAFTLGAGFVPIRKPGKLPAQTLRQEYSLEYGQDAVEVHTDAIAAGDRILLHDDLLATGGTAAAACHLIERLGGRLVGISFLLELAFLNGREKLKGYEISSLMKYEKE